MTDALRAALAAMLDADDQDGARAMARAALAAPVAPAVPAGWVLVPVDLLRDALESVDDYRLGLAFGESDRDVMGRLRGALDAAPQPTPAAVPSAEPAQVGTGCAECGKKDADGWALYCVACMEKIAPALVPSAEPVAERDTVPVPTVVAWSGGAAPYRFVRLRLDDTPREYEYVPAAVPSAEPRPITHHEAREGWRAVDADGNNVGGGCSLDGWVNAIRWAEQFHGITGAAREPETIHCAEKRKPSGCQLHNLHCGWPACNTPKGAAREPKA